MKIAVCISGLIGYTKKRGEGDLIDFYKTKKYFDKNLFFNNDVDYFIHCWNTNLQNEIKDLYNPKKYIFENPLVKNKKFSNNKYGILSNHYGKKEVIKLKKQFEKEKEFIYDLVILTRFDILILKKLNLSDLSKNKFYVTGPKYHHNNKCQCLFCDQNNINHCLNDCLFIGSSSDMDKFSKAHDHLDEYGYKSNHIITKKHILRMGLWEKIDYVFNWPTNKYPFIWNLLENIGLFPKGLVPARIYETDIPLIRWVDKSLYLKFLDLMIFKLKLDILYFYFIYRPIRKFKFILNLKK